MSFGFDRVVRSGTNSVSVVENTPIRQLAVNKARLGLQELILSNYVATPALVLSYRVVLHWNRGLQLRGRALYRGVVPDGVARRPESGR